MELIFQQLNHWLRSVRSPIAWEQIRSNRSIRSLLAFRPHVLDVAVFAFLLGSVVAAAAAEHQLVAWKVVVVQVAYILVFYVAFHHGVRRSRAT